MRVVVVGGGSAGWITAALINSIRNSDGRRDTEITLIESPRIGRIGVGEATIPTLKRTLRRIGISEADFLDTADATFKHGIRFLNWGAEHDHSYFHPFHTVIPADSDNAGVTRTWLNSDRRVPYIQTISEQLAIAEAGLSPKSKFFKDYEGAVEYAYHMDAEKFADTLATHATQRGVKHIRDEVTDVEMNDNGSVAAVTTVGGRRIEGDLFIDCTGFARVLIGQRMGAEFEDYGQWLLCDRAVALRVPYGDGDPDDALVPFTTATALGSGWCWDIRLQKRRGTGYVYSSAFLDADTAERDLRLAQNVPEDVPARHIKFQSGRVDRPWIKNVVAIGLSGGFLEPLESTGLYFVEEGVNLLLELFPEGPQTDRLAEIYNQRVQARYEECLDFINLHYCLTRRRDTPFWQEVAKPERITPRLTAMLAGWEQKLPARVHFADNRKLFGPQNFEAILMGMGWEPKSFAVSQGTEPSAYRGAVAAREAKAKITLPAHAAYLKSVAPARSHG